MTPNHQHEPIQSTSDNSATRGIAVGLPTKLAQFELNLSLTEGTLMASLSDSKTLLLVGETANAHDLIQQLEKSWTSIKTTEQFNVFSAALGELLPLRIRNRLANAPGSQIRLRLSLDLSCLPWECLCDKSSRWQDSHRVTRAFPKIDHIPSKKPLELAHTNLINVLLLFVDTYKTNAGKSTKEKIAKRLSSVSNFQVHTASLTELQGVEFVTPDESFDVLHLIGSRTRVLIALDNDENLAVLLQLARLLIVQFDDVNNQEPHWIDTGRRICRHMVGPSGVCIFQRPSDISTQLVSDEILVNFYQQLANGLQLIDWAKTPQTSKNLLGYSIACFGKPDMALVQTSSELTVGRTLRQVTALSYDLVGSTRFMHEAGKETYSIALREYHQRFAAIISRWGGVSDVPQGDDGIMCYFGVHHADEKNVRSALFAALSLNEEAKRFGAEFRFGIATGEVAIDATHSVGLSVHLAARIRALGGPGEVLICTDTAELIRGTFSLIQFQSNEALPGFSKAPTIFKVVSPKEPQNWVQWSNNLTKEIVGRKDEIAELIAHWQTTCGGTSLWVHLRGEAGIGKSHLAASAARRLEEQQFAQVFECRCFHETSTRAFAPIINLLERWFGIDSTDSIETRQAKLSHRLDTSTTTAVDLQAVHHILGVASPRFGEPASKIPETNRRHILQTMVRWMRNAIQRQPLLFILEDVQWADPSTLEFLSQLKTQTTNAPLLTVLTERTDQADPPQHPLADTSLTLDRLSAESVRALIQIHAGERKLSRHLIQAIEAKSDGIPLFIEMSTRMVLDAQQTNNLIINEPRQDFKIPMTIRDLLMQRLDSLGPARTLAQICSTIGREFSRELLSEVLQHQASSLASAKLDLFLKTLVQSGLLIAARNQSQQHFYFRHALIHDAAYFSMWETDRRELHLNIAETIEAKFPEVNQGQPEVLAHHYTASGRGKQAIHWHMLASKKYKKNEAHLESLIHLEIAKKHLQDLPDTPDRAKTDLEIELTSAGLHLATKGYGSQSAGQCYLAALGLAQSLKDRKSTLRAQLGLEAFHLMRADFGQAHAYLTQAQNTAKEFDDALTSAQCLFALANILHHQGHANAMQEYCNQCIAVCREGQMQNKLVQSPEVMSLMYSAVCLWEMGQVDWALQRAQEGVQVAEKLAQRLGLGQALGLRAMVLLCCGELTQAEQLCERALAFCEAGDHDMWTAHAHLVHGCCIAELGDPNRGMAIMYKAYELWTSTGTIITRTYYLALMAPVQAQVGNIEKALDLINEACRIIREHGERYYEPEVLRIKAELLLQQTRLGGPDNTVLAQNILQQALQSAQILGYRSLALRVAMTIVRIQNLHTEVAMNNLRSALGAVESGHNTRDQRQARELLEQSTT